MLRSSIIHNWVNWQITFYFNRHEIKVTSTVSYDKEKRLPYANQPYLLWVNNNTKTLWSTYLSSSYCNTWCTFVACWNNAKNVTFMVDLVVLMLLFAICCNSIHSSFYLLIIATCGLWWSLSQTHIHSHTYSLISTHTDMSSLTLK